MPKRRNPQNRIMDYFDTVPIEEAVATLAVCQWVVAKRQGTTAKPRATRKTRTIADVADAIWEQRRAANG
jgi:hypothetical protein